EWIKKEIEISKANHLDIIPVVMERLNNTGEALKKLQVSQYQAINFVLQRKEQSEKQLLQAIEPIKSKYVSILPYIDMIRTGDKEEQDFAIQKLGQIGNANAIGHIVPFLKSAAIDTRYSTALALGSIGSSEAIAHLVEFIKSRLRQKVETQSVYDYDIEQAILSLGWIGDSEASQFLLEIAEAQDTFRLRAIWALAEINKGVEVAQLGRLLSGFSDKDDEFFCIWALYRTGQPEASEPIITWLEEKIPKIQDIEDGYYVGDFDGNLYSMWEEVPHHYASDFIHDEVINVISASAVVLGALKNVSAFAVLLRMLSVTQSSEINEDQYCAAVLGLGLLGDVRAIEPLLVQLDSLTDAEKDSRATWEPHPRKDFLIEALRLLRKS
ncbi:MAG: HEAT repeat domain-containing protein, partial [Anaerolineae bacterium]|nr:HEAT repeat domain-containing protein [Anaerolineae bacterium]